MIFFPWHSILFRNMMFFPWHFKGTKGDQ
jgi:hypothetical protein